MQCPAGLRFLLGGGRAAPHVEDNGRSQKKGLHEKVPIVLRTRKRFGQHFLESAWADKVVAAIAPAPDDVFLEIGPGAGVLTFRLAPRVAHLTAIEIDRDLVAELRPRLPANVTLIAGDFLSRDLRLADSGLQSGLNQSAIDNRQSPIRVAGNLPYNVSSPILFRLLELQAGHPMRDATLMLQKEVADRIVARPGSADYGVLSVLTQWKASVSRLLTLPPGAFRPAPKVTSSLVRLIFRPPEIGVSSPAEFERLVRSVFTQRRKTLTNALRPYAEAAGHSAAAGLRQAGIDPGRRPQTLQLVEIARLADVFHTGKK
jgi:16S rRNA (adenine1518-N6/adenine1519-N6)-dimethyltransferase